MSSVSACNKIIVNVSERDRSDMILHPLMIAVVLVSYVSIFIYYTLSVFRKHSGLPPWEHLFGMLALLMMGISLILAVFYLLMVRAANHSKREASLRKALIEYVEGVSSRKNIDVSQHLRNLRGLDGKYLREEKTGNPKRDIIWVAVPGLLGFVVMFIPQLEDYILPLVAACFFLSVVIALIVVPDATTFGLKHDKRSVEFTAAFSNACRVLGMRVVPMSKSVGFRSFLVFLIITVITAGIFAVVWTYMIFSDMNKHFQEQWKFEDHLFRMVRSTEIQYLGTSASAVAPEVMSGTGILPDQNATETVTENDDEYI